MLCRLRATSGCSQQRRMTLRVLHIISPRFVSTAWSIDGSVLIRCTPFDRATRQVFRGTRHCCQRQVVRVVETKVSVPTTTNPGEQANSKHLQQAGGQERTVNSTVPTVPAFHGLDHWRVLPLCLNGELRTQHLDALNCFKH